MASSPKRARSAAAYIRLCDGFGHNAEHLIYPFIKAKESVRIMFKHQEESLIDALCRAEILLRPPPEMNCFDGNIFIENEPFAKWSEETLKRYRDRVNMELQKCNINNVMIDQVKEQSSLSQPMITESDVRIYELEVKYQYYLNKCKQDSIPAEMQIIGTLLKELKKSKISVAVLSQNGTGKSFLLNLLLLLTSESYRTSRKIKLPKDITGNPTIEIVKEEHFEDLPEVIKDFLDDITEDQQDFKSVMEPVCHELIFSSEMEQQNAEISIRALSRYFTDHRCVSIEPYLLPEKDNCQAYHCTTNCVFTLRHGDSFQAKVEFFNQEELQNQLFELVLLLGKEVSTDRGKNHRKSLKKRFSLLTRCKLEKEKLHKTLELITSPKDIILCDQVKEFAGKTELYVGNGNNPTYDRLALQSLLKNYTLLDEKDENSIMRQKVAALKRIVVYVPSNLLYGGKEILEMPGTIESDPMAMSFIQDELDTADAVIVLSEYAFKLACTEVKDVLRNSCFMKKWMKNSQEYKLMFVSYPEKNQPYQLGRDDIKKIKKIKGEEIKKRNEDLQELEKQLSQVLSEEMKKNIFSTTVLPVLHCSIHAMEGDPHGILEENKHFLENTGIYALIRELDQLTLKRKSVVIEEIENKFVEFEKYNMDKENENIRMDEETENRQLDEDCEISQMDEESEISQKDDKSQGENIGSASKSFIFKNETDFLKINEDLFEKLKNQNESLIEKTLNEQLKITIEKVAEPAKANLVTIRNSVTETRFFNPQYSGRHSCFKMNLYSQLFGHLDEEISIIFHDLIKKMRNYLDEYKQNAITLFTEELRDKKKLRTATVGNSLQCALGWYMGKTRSSFNEDNLVKTFKDLLTESMRKHILQPAYNKTTANTRLTEGEVAAQIEIVLLDVQSSFKKHIFSLYNEKWPANLARFMMRSYLPVTSISRPGCTFCGELKCTICIYIVHSDKFTSRAKKVYTVKEHLQCTTSNAIYLITCRRCSMQYVGQTSMTVRRRFIDHLSTINCKKDLSVSRHFNLPDHSRQDISLMVIDKVENSCGLLKREEYWIRELNTLQPNGLNATQ